MTSIPAEFSPLVSPQKLAETHAELGASIDSVLVAGKDKDALFEAKKPLLKRRTELEAAIELTEAEALMAIRGEGKEAHVMVGDTKVYLTNEESRKAHKRAAARAEREALAKVESEIQSLELDIITATENAERVRAAAQLVDRRAFVQGNLLHFLAGRP